MRLVDLYELIPVYPVFSTSHMSAKSHFPCEAPLCEDETGGIAYIDEASRNLWLDKVRKAENNRKYKKDHMVGNCRVKEGDLYAREDSRGVKWFYLAVTQDGDLVFKVTSRTTKGKCSFKHYLSIEKVPKGVKYQGVYVDEG